MLFFFFFLSLVSDIKLIRTDTTLDLSQKAEKGWNSPYIMGGEEGVPRDEKFKKDECVRACVCGPGLHSVLKCRQKARV